MRLDLFKPAVQHQHTSSYQSENYNIISDYNCTDISGHIKGSYKNANNIWIHIIYIMFFTVCLSKAAAHLINQGPSRILKILIVLTVNFKKF